MTVTNWVTHTGVAPTADEFPDYPLVRFDGGMSSYQEALVDGRYLTAHLSAMGRPKPRWWIWSDMHGGAASTRPLRRREAAFRLQIDSQDLHDGWEWLGSELDGPEHRVRLRHVERSVEVLLTTTTDGTPLLARTLVVTNTGDRPAAISEADTWSGLVWSTGVTPWNDVELTTLPDGPFSIGRMTDTTAGTEGSFAWSPLPSGTTSFESLRGRSGWGVPFCLVRNNATGELLVVDLAWSGNWRIELTNDYEPARRPVCDAHLYVRAGIAGPAPLRVLAPGESATLPTAHVGVLFGDLDAAVQAVHTHIRRSVVPAQPTGRAHLVEVNHTAFTRNHQVTERQLYDEIDLAAEAGAELFMLDAGWFGEVSSLWFSAVGDWDRESPLLEHGVRAALDRVRERGMLAGLWVEPERVGPASLLATEHPDWLMTRNGEQILNLDLSRPEIAAHTEKTLIGIIDRYQLDCFRLDYNHDMGEGGARSSHGWTENVLWRYYDALYGIFDRIHDRYPDLLLENCSSGGGRIDLGMMSRFHWTQVTDRWSPGPSARILNGATICLPPELCESVIGGISEGVSDLDFLIRLNLFCHFKVSGLFPTSAERNDTAFDRWQHGIGLYKDFCRPILPTSQLFHHTPIQRQTEPGDWVVLEVAAADRASAYIGVFRLPGATADAYLVRPRGLDPGRRYRVRRDTQASERVADGGTLMDNGIRVDVPGALCSELILIDEV